MARITGTYTDDLVLLIEGAVEAGVFGCKSDTLREFVRKYFDEHENERTAAVVALYEDERITLGDAARLANVDRRTTRDILREHGVKLRFDPMDDEDAAYEIKVARELDFEEDVPGDDKSNRD